jgi:hypothetical protein
MTVFTPYGSVPLRRARHAALLPLALACAAACSSNSGAPQASPTHYPSGPAGGILEADAGSIEIAGAAGSSAGASATAGAGGTAAGAGGASAGAAGSGGSVTGQAFVPNVPYSYVGNGSNAGLSIVAGTMAPKTDLDPAQWLIAVKGVGPDPVCIITIPADLLDAAGNKLAHLDVIIHSPMYTTFGSAEPCIGVGDTGMGEAMLNFTSGDASQVAQVKYGISGNIDPAAVKITGISVDNVTISDFSSTKKSVTGTLTNHSGTTYKYPEVDFFTVDPAGRPLATSYDLGSGQISGSGTFDFTMYLTSPIDRYVTYPAFDSL